MALWDNLKMNPTNILIGIGVAVAVPVVLPALLTVVRPLAKAAIKGGFALAEKVTEYAAEAGEQVSDLFAEAKAEHMAGKAGADAPKS